MTNSIVVCLNYYFELLKDINKKLIKIVGMDCINNYMNVNQAFYELAENIVVLVPCTINDKTKKIKFSKSDGIFNFRETFDFLENEIKNIIETSIDTFIKLKLIRNKHEHEPHFIYHYGSSSGSDSMTNITFKYNNSREKVEVVTITSEELICFVKKINNLFDEIMEITLDYINKCDDEKFKYVYINRYWRIKYSEYNEIYDSNLLIKISRAMN